VIEALYLSQEQSRAGNDLCPVSATIPTTVASAEVISEGSEISFAQIIGGQASKRRPSNDVFRRSNVAAGGYLRVAALKQLLSETFDLRSRRSAADRQNPRGCVKQLGKHDDLPW
jgi:hypothetical protein